MSDQSQGIVVLIADDDEDDRLLTADALTSVRASSEIRFVQDGQELLDYLQLEGPYDGAAVPRPDVILLDLNMPRRSGTEVLADLKADPALRAIPVVVLSTSRQSEDISKSYDLGACSYVSKPSSFPELVTAMSAFDRYWSDVVELPKRP